MFDRAKEEKALKGKKVAELKEMAKVFSIDGCEKLKKAELIEAIMSKAEEGEAGKEAEGSHESHEAAPKDEKKEKHKGKVVPDRDDRFEVEGILELADGGFGFLRFNNFLTSEKDIYVAPAQIRRFNLKTGDKIRGICRKPNDGDKFGALLYVITVNDDRAGNSHKEKGF